MGHALGLDTFVDPTESGGNTYFDDIQLFLLDQETNFSIPDYLYAMYQNIDENQFETVHYIDAHSGVIHRILSCQNEKEKINRGHHIMIPVMYRKKIRVINILKRKSSDNNSISNLEFNK